MPKKVWKRLFPQQELRPSLQRLTTYTGEQLSVCGELPVQVKYREQECTLTLTVVEGKGPALLGRDWLASLRLDWNSIRKVWNTNIQSRLDALLVEYSDVFQEGLGTMRYFKAKLRVKEGTKPVIHKPRPTPFAIRDVIGNELYRLEQERTIEKVA